MSLYIKRFKTTASIGPTEERGFALWTGYEIVGISEDLSAIGLTNVDDWPAEEIAAKGVTAFTRVGPDDAAMYDKLGIARKR